MLGALGWATFHALRLERLEAEARAQAHYQESIRLALWRMDSRITPIIAREAARPYFQYRPFYPAGRAYTKMLSPVEHGEVMVPSPLLQATDPYLKLYFERAQDGDLQSPQVPTGEMRTLAESVYVSEYAVVSSEQLLGQLSGMLRVAHFGYEDSEKNLMKERRADGVATEQQAAELARDQAQVQSQTQPAYRQQLKQSADEYQSRYANAQVAQQTANQPHAPGAAKPAPPADMSATGDPAPAAPAPAPATARTEVEKKAETGADKRDETRRAFKAPDASRAYKNKDLDRTAASAERDAAKEQGKAGSEPTPLLVGAVESGVVQGQFNPSWVMGAKAGDNELLYTREVDAADAHLTQGFWVDWASLRETLLADTRDLLPGATLRPLTTAPNPQDEAVLGRTLAALPAVLDAPLPRVPELPAWSPVRSTLLATWIAALGAMIAIALVLRTSMELAERRGRFVSAVTHELRTPLTTFCLYSQMLADGMVKSDEDRRTYVKTLSTESQRLARIVESVLEYARLGRRHTNGKSEVGAADLIDRIVPSLRQRCEQAGMQLVVEGTPDASAQIVADPATLERVLFNLVDNACKYAGPADDKRIHLIIESTARELSLTVRDHGPGLDRHEQRRIFRPFVRGHRQSDGSIPGLGLGLALSQGLAKELHGDLRSVPRDDGAEFRLRIPL